jgi:hypothetical protein
MGSLTFVSGGFSSGTTLLFTLFRNTEGCHCLFEPLHERLPQHLVWSPRVYEGHAFVRDYFAEYKGFSAIPELFDPAWGVSSLYLPPDASADRLYRYLSYLVGTAHGKAPNAVLKEIRLTFRLAWLKKTFPQARIVHVWRDLDEHWRSIVRRVQEHVGHEDVGQERADFMGFRIGAWCDDLAATYPELAVEHSSSGYERFAKLWELTKRENERHADVSVGLAELKDDFPGACARISDGVGIDLDPVRLSQYVSSERRVGPPSGTRLRMERLIDRAGMRYAEARVRARSRA